MIYNHMPLVTSHLSVLLMLEIQFNYYILIYTGPIETRIGINELMYFVFLLRFSKQFLPLFLDLFLNDSYLRMLSHAVIHMMELAEPINYICSSK